MTKDVTAVVEDYLKTIYALEEQEGVARTSSLTQRLHVVPGTVTNTIARLKAQRLVTHHSYKGVKLTSKGRRIALAVIRRHRLAERLLTDVLQVDWDKAHEEACKLEHTFTDDILTNVERRLDYPKTCPHGNPIPAPNGEIVEVKSKPLSALALHEKGRVLKIAKENAEILRYFASLGVKPDVRIEVLEKAPFDGPLTILVDGQKQALSPMLAEDVFIKAS